MLRSALFSMILVVCACSSASSSEGGGGQHGSVTADIDGRHVVADILPTVAEVMGRLAISAFDSDREIIGLSLVASTVGTYDVEPGSLNEILFSDDSGQYIAQGEDGSGTVTVTTSTSRRIAGTFSGMLVDSGGNTVRVVTNGMFDIDLQ